MRLSISSVRSAHLHVLAELAVARGESQPIGRVRQIEQPSLGELRLPLGTRPVTNVPHSSLPRPSGREDEEAPRVAHEEVGECSVQRGRNVLGNLRSTV